MININKGMYIEQLMNRTSLFYHDNNIGILEKRQIPIKILKHINDSIVVAKLMAKAKVDYFAYINGKYCELECKQTIDDFFNFSLLKKHQLIHLDNINKKDYLSYVIIYFEKNEKIVAISYKNLIEIKNKTKKNNIPFTAIYKFCTELEIIYPGILNLSKLFQ